MYSPKYLFPRVQFYNRRNNTTSFIRQVVPFANLQTVLCLSCVSVSKFNVFDLSFIYTKTHCVHLHNKFIQIGLNFSTEHVCVTLKLCMKMKWNKIKAWNIKYQYLSNWQIIYCDAAVPLRDNCFALYHICWYTGCARKGKQYYCFKFLLQLRFWMSKRGKKGGTNYMHW